MSPPPAFREALRFWTKLGWISFGGPAGQIAIMHREIVEKRRWLSEDHFDGHHRRGGRRDPRVRCLRLGESAMAVPQVNFFALENNGRSSVKNTRVHDGRVTRYVRPHEIELKFAAAEGVHLAGRVSHLFVAGPFVRLSVVPETGGRREIEVWETREQVDEMALASGNIIGLRFPGRASIGGGGRGLDV